MRVAHVIYGRCNPDSANGVDKTVYHLAQYQARSGAEVSVFSITNKEAIPIPNAAVFTFAPARMARISSHFPVAPRALAKSLCEWRPDVVHFHSVHIGAFIALGRCLRKRSIPYVVTPHGAFAPARISVLSRSKRAYIRLVERPYLENARFVHVVSQNDAQGLSQLGVRVRAEEIPNGIDFDTIPKDVDRMLLQRRFPQVSGRRVFLFLGRLDPKHKGLDLLLEAFAKVPLRNSALVLAGPDWRGSTGVLQQLCKELHIQDRVVFPGPIYGCEKWSCLASADVFVHTSRWEGFPFSVIEALAMGKPALVTSAVDPKNMVPLYKCGLTVSPAVDSIAAGIEHFSRLSEPELTAMASRAQSLASTYDWQKISGRLLAAYGE